MLGKDIIKLRMSLKMTQSQFANALGTTIVSISRWENDKQKPSRAYVKELIKLKEIYTQEKTNEIKIG